MIIDGSIHKSGFPIVFVPTLIKPIKDKHIMSPFELKIKKMLEALKKGKKKKTKKKGGGKSKYNIKMTRKFRRTRRKRGGGGGNYDNSMIPKDSEECIKLKNELYMIQKPLNDMAKSDFTGPEEPDVINDEPCNDGNRCTNQQKFDELDEAEKAKFKELGQGNKGKGCIGFEGRGGRKRSRRKRRRRTKKRKSRRRKKRSRRRRRKKR